MVNPNVAARDFVFATELGITPKKAVKKALKRHLRTNRPTAAVVTSSYGSSKDFHSLLSLRGVSFDFVKGRMRVKGKKHDSPHATLVVSFFT